MTEFKWILSSCGIHSQQDESQHKLEDSRHQKQRFGTDLSKTGPKFKRAIHKKQRVRPQDIQAIEEQIEQEDRPQKKRRLKASRSKMLLRMLLSVGLLIALLPTITTTVDQQLTKDLCGFVGSDHLL